MLSLPGKVRETTQRQGGTASGWEESTVFARTGLGVGNKYNAAFAGTRLGVGKRNKTAFASTRLGVGKRDKAAFASTFVQRFDSWRHDLKHRRARPLASFAGKTTLRLQSATRRAFPFQHDMLLHVAPWNDQFINNNSHQGARDKSETERVEVGG